MKQRKERKYLIHAQIMNSAKSKRLAKVKKDAKRKNVRGKEKTQNKRE